MARQLYIRAKDLPLVSSRSQGKKEGTDLTTAEFLEFLFRAVRVVCNPENYAEVEDEENKRPLLKIVPDEIQQLFGASDRDKFQFVLDAVLGKYMKEPEPAI